MREEKVVSLNENKKHYNHKDLKIWQKAIVLTDRIYTITAAFPKNEQYGLTSQLRRAAVSVASNIAEGNARLNTKEFIQFLNVARSSLAEIDTQLIIACRQAMVIENERVAVEKQVDEISRMIMSMIQSLKKTL